MPTRDRSPFASASVVAHLVRGVLAATLIALAISTHAQFPWLSAAAGVGALVLLRGCPLCWTIGLVETALKGPRSERWRAPRARPRG
ncbi:MAG: hypothetical protein RLZZ450_2587 [Pseudomonadota bacterium]|jgi:hypothetical protein